MSPILTMITLYWRSFPPVEPLSLKWEFPLWHAKDDIEPEIKTQKSQKQKQQATDDDAGKHQIIEFMGGKPPISASQCRKLMGVNRAIRLMGILEADGQIEVTETVKKNGHDVELFRLSASYNRRLSAADCTPDSRPDSGQSKGQFD